MPELDIKKLFEVGAHFGHKTSRWNPKMAGFIHSKRDDSHIINLEKTVEQLDRVLPFVTDVVARGRQFLFVGTKKQAREIVKNAAESVSQPYVAERWLGGMLTNVTTITSQIKKLKLLEKRMASGELANRYNKLEVQRYQEEIDALNVKYGGVKDLKGRPGALFVLDAVADQNAVKEAVKLGIPVVAICDTNADPTGIEYVIPANDDAIASLQLITDYIVDAVKAGENVSAKKEQDKPEAKPTDMAGDKTESDK
ncbi:30S ribosomal protein S2 [Candidatus Saccharibacteria bacterium]|nr:30S ribosomal protein S2 [Candidatus Saccharibacteria bacterium]MCL1962785.1 30S ribosomal protein S2 [Candidatus Saccharibacteria bacterium]